MRLSASTWSVLDLLRLRLGVVLHVFDTTLAPVAPEGGVLDAGVLDEPGIRERCLAVVTTSDAGSPRQQDRSIVTIPVRVGRDTQGVLVATTIHRRPGAAGEDDIAAVDAAAHIARTVIEADLTVSGELAQASERGRRLQGILRFLGVLTDGQAERDMMQSVVQAATVWFDLDCRIYYRSAPDTYSLFAGLPGLDPSEVREELRAEHVDGFGAGARITSPGDFEDFGWRLRRGEVLLLRLGAEPGWVMLIAGSITPDVEATFRPMARVLASSIERVARGRDEDWRRRLEACATAPDVTPERVAADMVQQLSTMLGTVSARLSIVRGDVRRTIAAVWETGNPQRQETETFQLDADTTVTLEVADVEEGARFEQRAAMRSWSNAVRPWLRGAAIAMEYGAAVGSPFDVTAFERRIEDEVERAKRFNLALGLVLVGTQSLPQVGGDPLLDVVRPALRASDLTGRVRGGLLAIVLVHSGAEGAGAVVSRLRARLTATAAALPVRIGQAVFSSECASAEALIRSALDRLTEAPAHP